MTETQVRQDIAFLEAEVNKMMTKWRRSFNRYVNNGRRIEDLRNQYGQPLAYYNQNEGEDEGTTPNLNVIRACIDTHVSKISETKVRPFFNPTGGTFKTLKTCRNAQLFFDQLFAQGATLNGELRVPTKFFELPGHQLLGGTWSSRDYVALGQDPRIVLPNVPIQRTDGSWSLYWNFDQYLKVYSSDPLRGWGVFGRAGIGDDKANPISWFLSFGVGGNSPLCGRESDTFGVGWYYAGTSSRIGPILETVYGPIGDGQGVELFYNVAVTPWLNVTPDLQVIVPARENVDTAVVAGLRAKVVF